MWKGPSVHGGNRIFGRSSLSENDKCVAAPILEINRLNAAVAFKAPLQVNFPCASSKPGNEDLMFRRELQVLAFVRGRTAP
jgi:hypothetical protein